MLELERLENSMHFVNVMLYSRGGGLGGSGLDGGGLAARRKEEDALLMRSCMSDIRKHVPKKQFKALQAVNRKAAKGNFRSKLQIKLQMQRHVRSKREEVLQKCCTANTHVEGGWAGQDWEGEDQLQVKHPLN